MQWIISVVLVALTGCGYERVADRVVQDRATDPSACPLALEGGKICADVQWSRRVEASVPGEVEIYFWENRPEEAAVPAVDPSKPPKLFFIMKCCKTPSAFELKRVQEGRYQATGIRLVPGEYWMNIQLGEGKDAERVEIDVVVE